MVEASPETAVLFSSCSLDSTREEKLQALDIHLNGEEFTDCKSLSTASLEIKRKIFFGLNKGLSDDAFYLEHNKRK